MFVASFLNSQNFYVMENLPISGPETFDPNQTVIPDAPPIITRNSLIEWLDNNLPNNGTRAHSQWKNAHIICEFAGADFVVWNAKNMRYRHFATPVMEDALQWLKENFDKPQPVPAEYDY